MNGAEDPERGVILAYSPGVEARRALATLLALDDRLAEAIRGTSEPMLGQIRLKWWYDAIAALDHGPPPAEPLLQALACDVIAAGVRGSDLARIAEGWAQLLADTLDVATLQAFAVRGAALFEAAGQVAGAAGDPLAQAGRGWALADLSLRTSDPGEAAAAAAAAVIALDEALAARWSRRGRALGAMAHLARLDLVGQPVGSPRRVARALWHRMTGR